MHSTPRFPFDALLFDLDGTLVATERFWPDAARAACLVAFPRLGIEREIPSARAWMGMVGLPLGEAFEVEFPDLDPAVREQLMAACVEEEHALLERGRAALLTGVEPTLRELSARGVRLGIASNCSQRYLDAMMQGVGLGRWIEEGRCLESRGIGDKAGMIEDLLLTFGTRSAVMVGDRSGDRDAAWANGVPHVHVDRGYAFAPEHVDAEALLDGMDQLVPRLLEREAWLDDLLARIDPGAGAVLGVTGRSASGKSLMARDLARRLEFAGERAVVVSLDDFLRPDGERAERPAPRAPQDHLEYAFDVARLQSEVLDPHRVGEEVSVELEGPDGRAKLVRVPAGAVLVLEGLFLAHPVLRPSVDRLLHLMVSDEVLLRRVAGRDARLSGVAALDRVRRDFLPVQRAFEALHPPRDAADLVVIADNPLG